jgi:cupin superfamily acireductone dioxygenase involved in methionine salvage
MIDEEAKYVLSGSVVFEIEHQLSMFVDTTLS